MPDRQMLDLALRYRGYVRAVWSAHAVPDDGRDLQRLLVDAAAREGGRVEEIADWTLEVTPRQGRRFIFATTADECRGLR